MCENVEFVPYTASRYVAEFTLVGAPHRLNLARRERSLDLCPDNPERSPQSEDLGHVLQVIGEAMHTHLGTDPR